MSLFSFDDAKVQRYIDWSIATNSVHYPPISSQLSQAYSSLLIKREKDDPNDEDDELAAAEHYMYARSEICLGKTSQAMMAFLTLGYDPMKVVGSLPGNYALRKLIGHHWSTPSLSSMKWGFRGISDGERDRKSMGTP